VAAWLALAAGATAAAVLAAQAAAEREDVTAKHPVTPGELLPARELEADLLLKVGQYPRARMAYDATLEREPGRARSIFGAARAAELSGDAATARARYQELLRLMEHADGARPELGIARTFLASR
jgi:tetratricopeptide (TPR) repeat protein